MGNIKALSIRPWSIYTLADPREIGVIRYVGVTVDIRKRMIVHLSESTRKAEGPYRRNWIKKLIREGVKPVLQVIETGEGDKWREAEKRWISHFRLSGHRLTNITDGGEGCHGYKPRPETIEKMRAAHRPTRAMNDAMSAGHPRKMMKSCHAGHLFDEDNTYCVVRKENGRPQRKCRECRKLAQRKYLKRKNARDVLV